MFIKSIQIKNFRLFTAEKFYTIDDFNIPDQQKEGSGLTIFVGENGNGKSSLLEAIALPYVSYKADTFSLSDMHDPKQKTEIHIYTNEPFNYKGTMPKVEYRGKGFSFIGGVRSRGNKGFLSSITVTDQRFVRADGETTPKDNAPDLRLSVNNPWSGPRFGELEFLILDKNRTFQTRKGTYNDTRFDRVMEDLNYQYLQKDNHPIDFGEKIAEVTDVKSEGIKEALQKFSEITDNEIELTLVDNWKPFLNAYFGQKKKNLQFVPLNHLGSGYEMIFSLIYSYCLSKKGNKNLIILIDEPELHLHPSLQAQFISLLLEFSRTSQVILTTHSPLFVKQAMENQDVLVKMLVKEDTSPEVVNPFQPVLSYNSANEVNFVAFNLATEEYHNELYEEIKMQNGLTKDIKQFDHDYFHTQKGEAKNSPWKKNPNEVTIHTFIRNQIHHRADNGKTKYEDLRKSIEKMRSYLT